MLIIKKIILVALTVLVAALIGHLFVLLLLKRAKVAIQDENGIGKWLGYFERALVALFVCLGLTSQTIFIFAVKAAVLGYRLPDNKDQQKNLAEYMLLGTMISYFVALVIGLCGYRLIKMIV